jgi:hypothetical protein
VKVFILKLPISMGRGSQYEMIPFYAAQQDLQTVFIIASSANYKKGLVKAINAEELNWDIREKLDKFEFRNISVDIDVLRNTAGIIFCLAFLFGIGIMGLIIFSKLIETATIVGR